VPGYRAARAMITSELAQISGVSPSPPRSELLAGLLVEYRSDCLAQSGKALWEFPWESLYLVVSPRHYASHIWLWNAKQRFSASPSPRGAHGNSQRASGKRLPRPMTATLPMSKPWSARPDYSCSVGSTRATAGRCCPCWRSLASASTLRPAAPWLCGSLAGWPS
jgi:hypothetical protein